MRLTLKQKLERAFNVDLTSKSVFGGDIHQYLETDAIASFKTEGPLLSAREMERLITKLKVFDIKLGDMCSDGGCTGHNEYEYCECNPRSHWIYVTVLRKRPQRKKRP